MKRKKELEEENQFIWKEIASLRSRIPNYDFAGLNVAEKKAYFKEGEIYSLANGNYAPPADLVTKKPYQGPVIKPLIPNHVADQLSYKDLINE